MRQAGHDRNVREVRLNVDKPLLSRPLTDTHVSLAPRSIRSAAAARLAGFSLRQAAAVLALAAVYVGAAWLGQSLRYTASVSAIWPPAGVGIAALYLGGLRLWPGIFIGELIVNADLLAGDPSLPIGSAASPARSCPLTMSSPMKIPGQSRRPPR